jgi:uncharacterized repeat protein (TIGR04052 family)
MGRRLLVVLLALAGCGGSGATYSVTFVPLVAGAPFSCTQTYPNIGTSMTTMTPQDFRMYVHDVQLVRTSGETVPLVLKADGVWQSDNIALLDFEDGTGTCMTNSPQTNFTVTGTAAEHSDYTGVQFTVGLPADQDHLNAATAMAPLNEPAMWWSWVGGYRYLRIDVASTVNSAWFFHLGAEACTGASNTAITCKYPDLPIIALNGFQKNATKVSLDLATLFADSNLDAQPDPMVDPVTGCMSSTADPECPPLFAKLGLAFESNDPGPAQTFFAVTQ